MPDAAAFQTAFARALASRDAPASTSLARALTIHRNTAAKAAQDALRDNFPVVSALVGDDAFAALAFDYVEAHPPSEPRLCFYGAHFPCFISSYPPFADHTYLADVAAVEWLVLEALFARDADAAGPDAFAELDLDRSLPLHPAVGVATVASPAGSLWLAHQDNDVETALQAIEWRAEAVLVTRPGNRIEVSVEPPEVIAFVEGCARRRPLSEVAAAAGKDLPDVFTRVISAGCITSSSAGELP